MLLHRLALRLGRTIAELEESMDAEEFERWRIFDQLEPIGDARADALAAMIQSTTAAAAGARVRNIDFMPSWARWVDEEIPPTPEEASARIRSAIMAFANRAKIPIIKAAPG